MTRASVADVMPPRGIVRPRDSCTLFTVLSRRIILVGLAAVVASHPGAAHAYLDPATGSLIIQTVVGGLAAAALVVKTYWHQIKSKLGLSSDESGSSTTGTEDRGDH